MALGRYRLLNAYISREFLLNFLVAFLFFFCIFFVNSILLLIQRILLKNIDFITMLQMVALSMPQFLIYTFPFATLTASSMVLGDLSSSNELLAIKSSGVSTRHVYFPIIIFSVFISLLTFFFSDVVHPWASSIYREKLSVLMAEMPTFEIEANSVNTVGDIVLYNGDAEGKDIYNLLLIDKGNGEMSKTVVSEKGTLDLIDPYNYVYSLTLTSPTILLNENDNINSFVYAKSENASFFLDFSNQIPSLTSNSPVNLSSRDLIVEIKKRNAIQNENRIEYRENISKTLLSTSKSLKELEKEKITKQDAIYDIEDDKFELSSLSSLPVNFTGQYYKAELAKKFALSFACFALALVSLPLSNIKLKHGKLTGFAISIFIAVAYWYMLFGSQLMIFDIKQSPYLLIFSPDLLILFIAMIFLVYFRKARR